MTKGMELLTSRLLTTISAPAMNKWTKVAPCVRHIAVLQNFCGLVPEACQHLFPPPEEDSGAEDEGQAVGAPLDESKAWRKLARLRVRKACHFLSDKQSSWATALWCVLTEPIMSVHFALFKHATWLSERVEENEAQGDGEELAPGEEEELCPKSMACFCKASLSPALKALESISGLVHEPTNSGWDPVVLAFGPVFSWSQERLRITRRTQCLIIGQCWRKLVYPFQQYPWALAPLVDSEASAEDKQICAQALYSCKACQLDAFARQLRDTVPEDAILESDTLHFLEAVLQRVVPTSTFIERVFARLSQWAAVKKGQKPKLSSISAKHISCRFQQCTALWRKRVLKQQKTAKQNIKRPVWSASRTKGRGANGWHVFSKEYMQQNPGGSLPERINAAKEAWGSATEAEKKRCMHLAQARNIAASLAARQAAADREACEILPVGSPHNVATPEGFPLARHVVANRQDQVSALSKEFAENFNNLEPENENAFVGAPGQPYPLTPICPKDGCMHSLPDAGLAVVQSLHDRFWFIVRHHAPRPRAVAQEVLLLSLHSEAANMSKDVAVMFHTRKAPWEAALLLLHRVSIPGLAAEGVAFSLAFSASAEEDLAFGRVPALEMTSDRVLFVNLAKAASDWTFHFLEVGRVAALSRFDIVAVTPFEERSFAEKAKGAEEAANALQALNILLGKNKKRSAGSRPQEGKEPNPRLEKRPKTKVSAERVLLGMDSGSEHGSNNSQESDGDEAVVDVDLGSMARPEMADHFDPASFSHHFSPSPVATGAGGVKSDALPPLRLGHGSAGVSSTAIRQRRGAQWGPFNLAPIYTDGVKTGYGAICGLHSNADDAPNIYCRKALTIGELSDEECRVRLKRWLLAGLRDDDWPEGQGRSMHLSLGGLRLVDFSLGDPEAVLDRRVADGSLKTALSRGCTECFKSPL